MPTPRKSAPAAAKKTAPVREVVPAPKYKPPKNAATAADRAYEARDQRLALNRDAEVLKGEETYLKEWLIETLPASDATGATGKVAQATIKTKSVPQAEDWPKIYAGIVKAYQEHVKKKTGQEAGAFAILNRAINAAAVEEMWEAGAMVPGIGRFTQKSVSLTRVK